MRSLMPSGEAGSLGPGACDVPAPPLPVAKLVAEARLPGMARYSAPTESVCAVSPGGAGSSWSRASGTEGSQESVAVVEKSIWSQFLKDFVNKARSSK